MNLKEIEKVVGSIRSNLFKNSNSFSVGMLKSHFKGAGLQFKEHQVYNPGDDVRFIDWKLTAKSKNTYIKTFEEERNIEIVAFLDFSNSMLMGYEGVSKLEGAINIICLLYLLAEKSKDKVRAVLYFDEAQILPPLSGHEGVALLVSSLEKKSVLVNGKINLKLRFEEKDHKKKVALIKSFIGKNKEVVFLSDFTNFREDLDYLERLIYHRNMHCFKVISPIDELTHRPFSIYTEVDGNKRLLSTKASKSVELHGRWKRLDVSTRYLESFIREML